MFTFTLLGVISASVIFIFWNSRNSNKSSNISEDYNLFHKHIYTTVDTFDHVKLVERCRANGPMTITFDEKLGYIENSILLMNSGINNETICHSNTVNICNTQCTSVYLRTFIQTYFKEAAKKTTKYPAIFRTYGPQGLYTLDRDTEGILTVKEDALKALGFVMGLALATETYLDTLFVDYFFVKPDTGPVAGSLKNYLHLVYKEQYKIYREIRDQVDDKLYKYIPDSLKPFAYANDDRDSLFYSAEDYPFDEAAKEIFYKPFKKSTALIVKGINLILNNKTSTDSDKFEDWNNLMMTHFFSDYQTLDLSDWKINSEFENGVFWDAMKELDLNERLQVYKKTTGLNRVPRGGFNRLPKTKIISKKGNDIFKSLYIIKCSNSNVVDLLNEIRSNLNK